MPARPAKVWMLAHRHAQTGDLGDAPGDEGGAGVVAVAEAGGDADAQRDDVLHSAAQLHALDVVIGVDAHDVVGKDLLHEGRSLGVLAGRHDGGGQVDGHLLCVGGAGQGHKADVLRAALPAQLIGKDLRHGVQRVRLDALCHVHDDLAVGHIGPGLCCRGADEDRRHREQQDVLVLADLLDALGEPQLLRDLHLRQVGVDAGRRKVIDLLLDGRPDQHIVPAHRQHPCKGHAPSSSAQNTNTFHHVCPPYPPRSRLAGRAACLYLYRSIQLYCTRKLLPRQLLCRSAQSQHLFFVHFVYTMQFFETICVHFQIML